MNFNKLICCAVCCRFIRPGMKTQMLCGRKECRKEQKRRYEAFKRYRPKALPVVMMAW